MFVKWTEQFSKTVRETLLASQDCHDKVQQTGWLKMTEIYFPTILEARNQKSRCWQGFFLLQVSEGGSAPCLSSRLWGLLAILGVHWCGGISPNLCFWCVSPLCVCATMSQFPSSYKDISHIRFSMPLTQHDLILIWVHLQRLFSNKSHLWFLGLGFEYIIFGNITQPTTEAIGNLTLSEVAITSWCIAHTEGLGREGASDIISPS